MNMFSPNHRVIRRICLLFCFFGFLTQLQSQCDPPDQIPTVLCVNAPVTCLQDACYSTSNIQANGWNLFCGNNTAIHNPQYFEVVVTDVCITISILVEDCNSGNALQAALVSNCDWQPCPGGNVPCPDVLDCDPGTGEGGTMTMNACGLTPGQSLWLLIDGSNGSQCQYTITFAQGILEPQIDEEITSGSASPYSVCQGFDDLFMQVDPQITNAHGYSWTLGWNNMEVTSTLPNITIDVDNNAPPGIHDVSVFAYSGCDSTEVFTFQVEIYEIDDVDKDPETFCPEEFPFSWHSITIPGEGTYQQTFDTPEGCPYDSIWTVEVHPDVPVGQLDVVYCLNSNFDPYFYEGEYYPVSGTYELLYPGMGLNGCDSSAMLDLTLIGIDAFIEHTCDNGEFVVTALIQELIPGNADVTYQWYVDGQLTFDNNPLLLLCDGIITIECVVTVSTAEGSCEFMLETYILNCTDDKPDPPVTNGDTLLCAEDGIFFSVVEDPFGEQLFYTWSGPPDVDIWDDGSGLVEMDFSFSLGGEVCVYATGECGDGPPTCFDVEIIPSPFADFDYELDVCIGTSTTITFTGSAGNNAEYVWEFDSPSSVTGSGEGPYNVTWNIVGDKVINLLVIEPGCDTAYATGIITISNLLAPSLNCSSTLSSVTFNWGDVNGASGYSVAIDGNPPVSTAVSEYTVSGLSPGAVVTMILTIESDGPCPDIILYDTCTAVDCPAPTIDLSGPDSLCLNAPSIVNLTAQVNGAPGTGVWTGPGIVNGTTGAFDPVVAGDGQHILTYTVDFNGCPFNETFLMTVFDSITADFVVDPLICIIDVANVTYTGNASSVGPTFAFDFGTATVVSGSGAGPYQLRYATPGNKTIRLQIFENGCSSDIITQNLTVVPTLTAPVVNCVPTTSDVTFTWPNTNPAGYTVNVLSGHAMTQVGATQVNFPGLVPGNQVIIQIVSLNAGPCPIRLDTFSCTARDCPLVGIDLTPVADICLYPGTSPITLEVTVTGGNGVGDWAGPGITDVVNGVFDPVLAGEGSHVITYHYLDDGCDYNETITIDVYEPPIAFISNTSFVLTCAGGNVLLLDGSGSSGGTLTYEWSTDDGFINDPPDQDKVEVGAAGTYQLKVIDITGCVDSTSVVVTEDANTPDVNAGPDKIITCDSTIFTLGGASEQGPSITYQWTTVNGNIIGASDGITISADRVGVYTLTVRDMDNGCQAVDAAQITIDTALASITLTAGDTIDCNTPVSGVTSSLSAPVAGYSLLWSTTDGTISGDSTVLNINVTQGGTYTLTITNRTNGCTKSASSVVAESDEIIDDVDVESTNVVCFGENNGTLTINEVIGGIPPYIYQWSISPSGGNPLTDLSPGQYTLTVTDQNGCSFIQVFTITEPPKVTADVGPNSTVAGGDSVTINLITNVDPAAIGTIDWSGYDGLNCPGCPSLQFIASSSGTIIAVVTDTAGCSAIDSMRLTVIVPRIIYIPTVFSPNGDDINDKFFISGRPNLIGVGYMRIYDRWGNLVFDRSNLTPGNALDGWDGTYKEQPMLPGVYVYVAELIYEDIEEVITGDITIIR